GAKASKTSEALSIGARNHLFIYKHLLGFIIILDPSQYCTGFEAGCPDSLGRISGPGGRQGQCPI
ncbi:MAG TPA: hypothetical protein VJJ98_00200, partial [Sedimentisphaerales bacterium]|nr:hypothetical protein [Sedimentisphaerales bacterium]